MKIQVGTRLGKIVIIEDLKHDKYRCKCDCGNEFIRRGYSLSNTKYPTCGCGISEGRQKRKLEKVIGEIKNNCKIIDGYYLETEKGRRRLFVECECLQCHNHFEIRYDMLNHLRGNNCPQCNIKAAGKRLRKQHRDSKLWRIWWGMKQRCYKETNKSYKDYGARGVKLCDEWLQSYESFYEWSINNGYGEGLSIDRIDTNGNYEPSNCRWVDQSVQNGNTRRCFFLWYNNRWCTVDEIAKAENISYAQSYGRYVINKKTRLPKKMLYDIDKITK